MLTTVLSMLMASVLTDGVQMEFMSSGATAKAGGYRPVRAEMKDELESIVVRPQDLVAPRFGEITLDGVTWAFILDEPEDGEARLFIDANGDGDLSNDPAVEWVFENGMHRGSAEVQLGKDRKGTINCYRFNPNDPQREALKNTLLYYADYGSQVTFQMDGQEFKSFVAGLPTDRTAFWIDRDGNGRRSAKREMAQVGRPFNFTGTTYVINWTEGELTLDRAPEPLPMTPLPPDTSIGQPAIPFTANTTSGSEIRFPQSYEGKVVMLDFWATWCGPCIAEIPHMKEAYNTWHEQGFEILGISFDREDMADKLAEFTESREMPWPQIYEGKYWDTTLGELYDVSGIPFVLLVDGSTGEILGTARELRGPGLTEYIGKVLESRGKVSK